MTIIMLGEVIYTSVCPPIQHKNKNFSKLRLLVLETRGYKTQRCFTRGWSALTHISNQCKQWNKWRPCQISLSWIWAYAALRTCRYLARLLCRQTLSGGNWKGQRNKSTYSCYAMENGSLATDSAWWKPRGVSQVVCYTMRDRHRRLGFSARWQEGETARRVRSELKGN